MKRQILAGLAAGVCALATLPASAATSGTPLAPGSSDLTLALSGAATPDLTGGAIVTSLLGQPYVSGSLMGTLDSWVISGDAGNPFGAGALTFVYRINNGALDAVTGIGIGIFPGFSTDVGNNVAGGSGLAALVGSTGAFSATRSAGPAGNNISFAFVSSAPYSTVASGTSSSYLVVETNAKVFTTSSAGLTDHTGATALDLAPIAPSVPDGGSTMLLLGAALSGIALLRRKMTA